MQLAEIYLENIKRTFHNYKALGNKSFTQLAEEDFYKRPGETENSIAVIIQHLAGNMKSRFSDFLTTDGEKPSRRRDEEFEDRKLPKVQLMQLWEEGWQQLTSTINALTDRDLTQTVYIRQEPLFVVDALNRQLAHYAYHVGQIVHLAKQIKGKNWQSLSIPKGESDAFNKKMMEANNAS